MEMFTLFNKDKSQNNTNKEGHTLKLVFELRMTIVLTNFVCRSVTQPHQLLIANFS